MKTSKQTCKKVLLFLSAFFVFIGLHCQANAAGSLTLTGAIDCIVPIGDSTGFQCDGEALTTGVTSSSPVTLALSWAIDVPSSGSTSRIFNIDTTTYGNEMTLTIGDVILTEQDIGDSSFDDPIAYFTDGVLVHFELDWFGSIEEPQTLPGYPGNDWIISVSGDSGIGDTNIQFEFIELNASGDWFQGYISVPSWAEGVPYDFNGDGKTDILTRLLTNNYLWLLEMDGSAVTTSGPIGPTGLAWNIEGIADFNGDRKADILLRNTDGLIRLYEMDGNSISATTDIITLPLIWVIVGVADFNGDSKTDILFRRTTDGYIYLYEMNGGIVTGQGGVATPDPSDWQIVGLADFNGDNKTDILLRKTSGLLYLYQMDGSTATQLKVKFADPVWSIIGLEDFNNDSKADILFQNSTTGYIYLFEMNGNVITTENGVSKPDAAWDIAGLADFNGDKKCDIVLRNSTTGYIWLFEMDGNTITNSGGQGVKKPDLTWEIIKMNDFNGDGKADILLWDTIKSKMWLYEMNGNVVESSNQVGSPLPGWEVM